MTAMNSRDQGKLLFQKGKFGAAAESFTEAIVEEPDVAILFSNRALCYQKLSRWADMLHDAGQAAQLLESAGSSSVKARYLQGSAFLSLNRYSRCLCFNFNRYHLPRVSEFHRGHSKSGGAQM